MSATITIESFADADSFLVAAFDWLLRAEAENNLLLGIALNPRGRAPTDAQRPYWIVVREDGAVVACVCRTPPHPVVLSRAPPPAVTRLVAELSAHDPGLNAVTGPAAETEAFAAAWSARNGGRWTTRFRLRLHSVERVTMPARPPAGSLRTATERDLALAREWTTAYVRDTGIAAVPPDMAQRLIDRGQLFLWADGEQARSMVAAARDTGTSCSINTVYTPPRFRGRGYASAAVAALTRHLLDAGRRFCCLYTDLANPTSNSIYAKIGYRPIRDDIEIVLER